MRKGTASGKSGAPKYVRLTVTPEQRRRALRSIDWKRVRAMTEEEIERNALDDPDSIVPFDEATEPQLVLPMPDVAALRRRLKLSQAEFANRFGFSVATVRNWEQGRVLADGAARVLLAVIANEPQAVIRALRPVERTSRSSKPRKKAA
jgi:putative transcriptional regulator